MAFRRDEFVKSVQGQAIPGAQVWVCDQPANTFATPPSPLSSIFSDVNGLVPITQPIITDGFGHAFFYVVAGIYTIVVSIGGVVQQVYPDQLIGNNGVGSVTFLTGGIPNIDQAALNLIGTANIILTPDGVGGVTIDTATPIPVGLLLQTNGVTNTVQSKLNLHSSDASIVLSSDGAGNVNIQGTGGSPSVNFNTAASGTITGLNNGSANTIKLCILDIPFKVTFARIAQWATTGDNGVNLSDWGIYNDLGNLVADVGATTGVVSSTLEDLPITQGPISLSPGRYFYAITSNVTGLAMEVYETTMVAQTYTTATTSSGGVLPLSIVIVPAGVSHTNGDLSHAIPILALS